VLLGDFDGTLLQSAHYPHFETIGTLQIRAEKRNPIVRFCPKKSLRFLGFD
jgi:hypothetical protein